jgi:hypothetical protein
MSLRKPCSTPGVHRFCRVPASHEATLSFADPAGEEPGATVGGFPIEEGKIQQHKTPCL